MVPAVICSFLILFPASDRGGASGVTVGISTAYAGASCCLPIFACPEHPVDLRVLLRDRLIVDDAIVVEELTQGSRSGRREGLDGGHCRHAARAQPIIFGRLTNDIYCVPCPWAFITPRPAVFTQQITFVVCWPALFLDRRMCMPDSLSEPLSHYEDSRIDGPTRLPTMFLKLQRRIADRPASGSNNLYKRCSSLPCVLSLTATGGFFSACSPST